MKIFKNLSIFTFIFIATTVDISSKIKNNILVKVGDQIITSFELENKIKIRPHILRLTTYKKILLLFYTSTMLIKMLKVIVNRQLILKENQNI